MEWTTEYINDLPDGCFAFIESGGAKDDGGNTTPRSLRHFPYKDKAGKIDLPHLRNAMERAAQSEFGDKAMPKLKAAAKQMKVGEYAEGWKGGEGIFRANVQMTAIREQMASMPKTKPNDEKREIVIPLLIEGWGNQVDNNYYTAKAVTEAASFLLARKKMYLNHPKDEKDDRDLRDWAASIQETWVDTLSDGRRAAFGRTKIMDNWLWERAKVAPDELAASLIGRGRARKGQVDGKEGNIIESIEYVRSCDFVDYGGNVPFGMVYFVENDKSGHQHKQEETEMQITEVTIGMLRESRPELVSEIEKGVIKEQDRKIADLEAKLKESDKTSLTLKAELDAIKLKDQLAQKQEQKKGVVDKLLKESKLPEEAKTDVFKGLLMSVEETKNEKGQVVTVEEQVKSLISDREAILGIKGVKNMGDHKAGETEIAEAQKRVNEHIFGLKEKKEETK